MEHSKDPTEIGNRILEDIAKDMEKRAEKIRFAPKSWKEISANSSLLCPVCYNYTPELRFICDNEFCPFN